MKIISILACVFILLSVPELRFCNLYHSPTHDGKSWMVLNEKEIFSLSDLKLDDTLTEIAIKVIPEKEKENDPLDHYVEESDFIEESESSIIAYIQEHFEGIKDKSDPNMLFRLFYYDTIKDSVGVALGERNMVIRQQREYRKNKDFEKYMNVISRSIKSIISDTSEIKNMVDTASEMLKHFSSAPTIRKALSYPIVKDEIFTALKKQTGGNVSWYDAMIEAIAPFLREGIIAFDEEKRANQSRDIAVTKVCGALIHPIGVSVIKEIEVARRYDVVLHSKITNNSTLLEYIESMMVPFRKAISYSLYNAPNDYKLNSLDKLRKTELLKSFRKVSGYRYPKLAQVLLYRQINESIPLIKKTKEERITYNARILGLNAFKNITQELQSSFLNMMDSEFTIYKKLQDNFTKTESSKLAEIARTLLRSKYIELNENYFNVIASLLHNKEDTNMDEDGNASNLLHTFNEELESHAIRISNFKKGSFTYSRAYLIVLRQCFPSIEDPFKNNITVLQKKDEL